MTAPKVERNQHIYDAVNAGATYAGLARELGITRELVRALYHRMERESHKQANKSLQDLRAVRFTRADSGVRERSVRAIEQRYGQ